MADTGLLPGRGHDINSMAGSGQGKIKGTQAWGIDAIVIGQKNLHYANLGLTMQCKKGKKASESWQTSCRPVNWTIMASLAARQEDYMEKGSFVKDISPGTLAGGFFVVEKSSQNQARNGPFWRLTLTDTTGSVEAVIWSPLSNGFSDVPEGRIVHAEGRAGQFRDQLQLVIEKMTILEEEEAGCLELGWFVRTSPVPVDAMLDDLHALCQEEFRHPGWKRFVSLALADPEIHSGLRIAPAAKGIHHAYAGGLLEHSLGVCKLCRAFADQYPQLDRQTLLAGALFHDIGKLRELAGGLATSYTDVGRLVGHIVLGVEMLAPHLAASGLEEGLCLHLRHLVLSHHGQPEYGTVRMPQTAEAFALHFADNLDAKMAQCREVLGELPEGQNWSPWLPSLSRQLMRPEQSPGNLRPVEERPDDRAEKKEKKNRKPGREECLSLLKA